MNQSGQYLVWVGFFILAILIGLQWWHFVVYICTFLINYVVKHHPICLFAICISLSVIYLFRFIAHFFIIFFSYWILCSLYNLKTPLLDTYLQIFFSQSVVCLSIFLALYLQDKILILKVQYLSIILLWIMLLMSCLKTHCQHKLTHLFLCTLLEVS